MAASLILTQLSHKVIARYISELIKHIQPVIEYAVYWIKAAKEYVKQMAENQT